MQTIRRLYRSRDGVLLGVCAGMAEYFDFNPNALRFLVVLIALMTWILPVILAYIVMGLVLKPAPAVLPTSDEEADFWSLCYNAPDSAMERIRRRRADLDRRLQRLESIVTSSKFDLEQEIRKL